MLQKLISLFLSIVIATTSCSAFAASHRSTPLLSAAEQREFTQNLKSAYWGALDIEHPELVDFAFQKNHELDKLDWRVDRDSQLIDPDPFFLRSQRWVYHPVKNQLPDAEGSLIYRKLSDGGFSIQQAHSDYALHIQAPLTPLLETKDYILLVSDSDDFFNQRVGEDSPDQGVFFFNKADFVALSIAARQARDTNLLKLGSGVPVYFFPLPGKWSGVRVAFEWAMRLQYALYNQKNEPLLVDISDFRKIEEVSLMNLEFSRALQLLADPREAGYPLRDSTALFGLYLSGKKLSRTASLFDSLRFKNRIKNIFSFEKAHADENVSAPSAVTSEATLSTASESTSSLAKPSLLDRVKQTIKDYKWSLSLTAAQLGGIYYAFSHSTGFDLVPDDMIHRMTVAASIIGSAYVGAVALKYSLLKDHFALKYPKVEGESILQKTWREIKGHLDIFPQNTNLIEHTPMLSVFNSTSYAIDRWFSHNRLTRKLYENTFGWISELYSSLPVNRKSLLLGLAEGHAASITVATSLLFFYPWLFQQMGLSISGATAGAAGAALATHFISSEIIRVYFNYFRTGSQTYTLAIRMSLRGEVEAEVDRELEIRGLNPYARSSRKIRQDLIEETLNAKMVERGLADRKDFIFDFNSLVAKYFGFKGVTADQIKLLNPDVLEKNHFIFEEGRWGLMMPAMKMALERAKAIYATSGDSETGRNVIKTLEWAISRFSYTKTWLRQSVESRSDLEFRKEEFFKNPAKYLLNASRDYLKSVSSEALLLGRDVRKVLWLASTSGAPDEIFQILPDSWVNASQDSKAARLAAEMLHYAVHSLHDKQKDIFQPDSEDKRLFYDQAHEALRGRGYDTFEYRIRFDQAVSDFKSELAEKKRIESYNPLRLNWYESYQYRVGATAAEPLLKTQVVHANDDVAANTDEASQNEASYSEAIYSEATHKVRFEFAKAIAADMGLYLKSPETSDVVRRAALLANERTEEVLDTPIEKNFLESIDANERVFYAAWVYTQEFLQSYINLTVKSDKYLEYGSPERPGRLQKIRQALVGAPGYKTFFLPVIYAAETIFKNDAEAYRVGLKGLASRMPLLPDIYSGLVRTSRTFPYTVTAGYAISITFFQSTLTWPQAAFFSSLYCITMVAVEMTNRIMSSFNMNPMKNLNSRLMYTYVLSWLISVRYIPMFSWSADFDQAVREHIVAPAHSLIVSPVKDFISSCARLLGGG